MRWLSAQGTRLSQPQGAVGAASQTPWALFSFGEGARPKNRGLRGPQGNWTLSASNSLIATAAGLGLKNGTSVRGAVFADVRAFDGVSPANSPLWYMVTFVHGAYVNQGSGINLVFQYGSPDSSAGIYLLVNSANVLTAVVANTALTGPTLVAGRAYAVVAGRDASGACWLWVNGAKVASGTGATAALSAQSSALYLSGGEGTNRAFQGVVNAFAMGSESPSEFGASISANPWQLFEPERRIWAPVVAGGGSVSLTIADALHSHLADALALTMDSAIAVADALHAHSADALGLTSSHALTVADCLHSHAADSPALTLDAALVIAEAIHAHAAEGLALTMDSVLSVADALHAHTAEALVLSDAPTLGISDALHAHLADAFALTQDSTLAIAEALHAHVADVVGLTTDHWLAIADALHAHAVDILALTEGGGAAEVRASVASRLVQQISGSRRPSQLGSARRPRQH